jgi:geranylgeranyl diphosphate synthase type II
MIGNEPSTNGTGKELRQELPQLPPRVPLQVLRTVQSNIPAARLDRDHIKRAAAELVAEQGLVPPISLPELRVLAAEAVARAGLDPIFVDFAAVYVNNASWRDTLAAIPYERRLLLLPKCLRLEEHCPAPFDQFGLLCKECGLCSIQDLTSEAERLGYAVLVAEGSALVRSMIETGRIEAIVGVSCLNVLERSFPHMEAGAIPGVAIPLLQDDCVNTNVDMDQVWDVIHLTSDDRTYRLDLDALKRRVESWFTPEAIEDLLGPASGDADRVAREWLARDGKRWRPYLAAALWTALSCEEGRATPEPARDVARVALAVECFHKASLIHDDIEDHDERRYGQETLHVELGVPIALNAGDLLIGEGYRLLGELECAPEIRARLMAEAARGHVTLARGQGSELAWTRSPAPLTSLEVLDIFRKKTAPAFEVALRLGALLAGATSEDLELLSTYSEALGIAYQIRDDLEDWDAGGDSDDLADLRPSLILAIAAKRAQEGSEAALVESLWRRQVDPRTVTAELASLFEARSVLAKARELRDAYEQQAVNSLRPMTNASAKGLLRRVIGKIFGEPLALEGHCGEFEARNAALRADTTAAPSA